MRLIRKMKSFCKIESGTFPEASIAQSYFFSCGTIGIDAKALTTHNTYFSSLAIARNMPDIIVLKKFIVFRHITKRYILSKFIFKVTEQIGSESCIATGRVEILETIITGSKDLGVSGNTILLQQIKQTKSITYVIKKIRRERRKYGRNSTKIHLSLFNSHSKSIIISRNKVPLTALVSVTPKL